MNRVGSVGASPSRVMGCRLRLDHALTFGAPARFPGLEKGVDDGDAVEVMAMGEVLRVDLLAAKFLCGGDDGGVPVGDLESAAKGCGDEDQFVVSGF